MRLQVILSCILDKDRIQLMKVLCGCVFVHVSLAKVNFYAMYLQRK